MLEQRRRELSSGLQAGDPRELAEMLSVMMLGFGGASRTEADAKKTTALYVSQLVPFPAWAVKAACQEAMGNGSDFAPSVSKLVALARHAVSRWQIEAARITQILEAAVYREPDQAERQRVAEGFDRIMSDLGLNNPIHKQARNRTEAEARDWLDAHAGGEGLEPVANFSDSLLETLGVRRSAE